jgi:hypothetical protein
VAELGETQDPTQLVQGKPEAIEENARVLRARAGEAGNAAEGLKAIDTGAWTVPGAQAFQDRFVRREALCFRVGVRDLHRLAVAAAGWELRAA